MTTNEELTKNIDFSDPEFQRGFKEAAWLQHMRGELHKLARLSGETSQYSPEKIDQITESLETFQKAAEEEARGFWTGFEEALRKEGADDAFIEGIKKEASEIDIQKLLEESDLEKDAGAGDFFRMLASPTMWRNPGAQIRGAAAGLRSGRKGVEKFVKDLGSVPGAGLRDTQGNPILHSTTPKHIPGSRTKAYADAYEAALGAKGKTPTPNAQKIIDNTRNSAIDQGVSTLRRSGDNAFQQEVHNIAREARQAGTAGDSARDALNRMSKGDFGGVAGRMNVDPTDMNRFKGMSRAEEMRANIPKTDSMHTAQQYAQDAAASGFNMSGLKTPKFNPEVAAGKAAPNMWFRASGKGAMKGGLYGALGGSMIPGVGPILGGLGGAAVGGLGVGGAGLATGLLGAGGTYAGGKALGLWGKDNTTDLSGAPADRNRVVPFLKNNWAGGIGGLLLASLLSQQMGLQGPMAWIVPLLGGVLGYNYLPQMMNRWKDPYGYGANAVGSGAAFQNNQAGLTP